MTIPLIIALVLVLILTLIAIKVGMNKEESVDPFFDNVQLRSGIYSVVRKSPREHLLQIRPSEEEIRKYLSRINEDICKLPVTDSEKLDLLHFWNDSINSNVEAIESGDRDGVEFYYYGFPRSCPGCKGFVAKGHYVSREEIYRNPSIVPPFHIGCNCIIMPHSGGENLKETTELSLRPFFEDESVPPLPEWTSVVNYCKTDKV